MSISAKLPPTVSQGALAKLRIIGATRENLDSLGRSLTSPLSTDCLRSIALQQQIVQQARQDRDDYRRLQTAPIDRTVLAGDHPAIMIGTVNEVSLCIMISAPRNSFQLVWLDPRRRHYRHTLLVQCRNRSEVARFADRKSTRLNSSHLRLSRMPSSA